MRPSTTSTTAVSANIALLAGFKSGCILEYKVAQAVAGKLPKDVGAFFERIVDENFKKNAEFIRRIS